MAGVIPNEAVLLARRDEARRDEGQGADAGLAGCEMQDARRICM